MKIHRCDRILIDQMRVEFWVQQKLLPFSLIDQKLIQMF